MSNWKLILSSVVGPLPTFVLSYVFFQNRPVLGLLFAALGCLLLAGSAWVMGDRIRTSETPMRPDGVAGQLLSGFSYLMLGGSIVIVVAAVLQGFGVINWRVHL